MTGGIYIQGTLDQCLMSVDASGNQVFTCKQGANTWTVTVKKSANATTIKKNAGGVQNYGGFPKIMYVNGTLSDLRGPDRVSGVPPPAIATNTEFLVAAKSDVVLQRDIVSQDFNANSSILGIYSTAGNVRVATGAPNDMQLDAMVMAAGASASFTVDDYKTVAPRGTFHLRGGITESFYGAFGTFGSNGAINHGYGRDFHYDPRGLVPPYFPATNRAVANIPTARTVVWKEI